MQPGESVRYLSVEDVLAHNRAVMAEFGQSPAPLRGGETGHLEAALARVENMAALTDADVITQAAVLTIALSQAQAFIGGNKRTAIAAGNTFLRLNGFGFTGQRIEWAEHLVRFGELPREKRLEGLEQFERWLRIRCSSDPPQTSNPIP